MNWIVSVQIARECFKGLITTAFYFRDQDHIPSKDQLMDRAHQLHNNVVHVQVLAITKLTDEELQIITGKIN